MGKLSIIPTPIGNLEDITIRALRIFKELDVLACEDTRRTRKILTHYDIRKPRTILSYHEHNEHAAGKRILGLLKEGRHVGLCSDSGAPTVSDPGYRIVTEAIQAGHEIDVLPGASATLTALISSGLPTSSFTFKGFPPRKPGPRRRFIENEKDSPHTLIFFESPYRLGKFLQDAYDTLGNRRACVCLELTKKFERIHRAPLEELAVQFEGARPKGEITIIIAGNNPKFLHPIS